MTPDLAAPAIRILLVDDERLLLSAFSRFVRVVRPGWQLDAVESAEEARQALSRGYDVVVSDLTMPGEDGLSLLRWVKRSAPDTARILWSGSIETARQRDILPVAHRVFDKPQHPERFVAALDGFLGMRSRVPAPVRTLATELSWVPSLPDAWAEANSCLMDPTRSVDHLHDVLLRDPSQTAKLLQVANSAFVGASVAIDDPRKAAQVLGLTLIRDLVLLTTVFDVRNPVGPLTRYLGAVRSHALFVGSLAFEIARPEDRSIARTAGILHTIGLAVIAANEPDCYVRALARARQGERLHRAERDLLGTDHVQLGSYLLGLWGLPNPIIAAVLDAIEPVPHEHLTAGDAVSIARALAADWLPGAIPQFLRTDVDRGRLREIGCSELLPSWTTAAQRLASSGQ